MAVRASSTDCHVAHCTAWLRTFRRCDGVTVPLVTIMRRCSRTACAERAVATLTYVYADQTAVLGPLATFAEPHTYDLCADHSRGLTAPRGWQVVKLVTGFDMVESDADDLLAVVDAVDARASRSRSAAAGGAGSSARQSRPVPPPVGPVHGPTGAGRGRHLRILRDGGDSAG